MTGTLASEFPIRYWLRKNFILTRRARCQNNSAGQRFKFMSFTKIAKSQAQSAYDLRRDELKSLSRIVKMGMKTGAIDAASVNDGLIQLYAVDGHEVFNTFYQWKAVGKSIIKGSKAFTVWGSPHDVKSHQQPVTPEAEGEEDEFKYWPLCYLFSNLQVTDTVPVRSLVPAQ
jgi:hypothetical protein